MYGLTTEGTASPTSVAHGSRRPGSPDAASEVELVFPLLTAEFSSYRGSHTYPVHHQGLSSGRDIVPMGGHYEDCASIGQMCAGFCASSSDAANCYCHCAQITAQCLHSPHPPCHVSG